MTAFESDDLPTDSVDRRIFTRLLGYLRPHWRLAAVAAALLAIHAGLAVVGPALTQRALDRAIPAGDTALLLRYALIFLAALLLTFVVDYAQTILTTRIGQRVMADLRGAIFGHLTRLSVGYFDRHPVGRLMTRVTSDVETLNDLFSSGVVSVFGDLFTLAAILTMMMITDWRLAVVTLMMMPLMGLIVTGFRRRIREAFRDIRGRVAKLNSYLQEHLAGVQVVQLFGRERAAAAEFAEVNRGYLQANQRSITIYAIFFPLVELVTAVAMALILAKGSAWVVDGSVTVGVLAAFIQLTRRFFQPLQDLSEKVNLVQTAMASSERIFVLLDTAIEVQEPAVPVKLTEPVRGEIRFEGVWFRYAETGPWVLEDVTFHVAAGSTVAVVGHTGAGKTTIVSLLLRFYDPVKGRITLDGVDIRNLATGDLRRQFGFVQQELFLFAGDILRNLALDPGIGEDQVQAAAGRVGIDGFIARLPGGYRHVLTERGRNLSVGERQLLSFSRALARNPRILLLDEATSSVDSESEARIQRGVDALMAGRTSVVIAHRLSTILHAEEILVLHHGRVVERGRHAELVRLDGVYQRLSRLQRGTSVAQTT